MDLPPELRLRVYEYATKSIIRIDVAHLYELNFKQGCLTYNPRRSLLSVSRQIRAEATPLYAHAKELYIIDTANFCPSAFETRSPFARSLCVDGMKVFTRWLRARDARASTWSVVLSCSQEQWRMIQAVAWEDARFEVLSEVKCMKAGDGDDRVNGTEEWLLERDEVVVRK